MKNTPLINDQRIIEAIIINGQTDLLKTLFDEYYEVVYNYLYNFAKDPSVARILSYFAMKRILLSLHSYSPNQSFLTFIYINAYKTCSDWLDKKSEMEMNQEKINHFQTVSKAKIKEKVINSITHKFWKVLVNYFEGELEGQAKIKQQLPTVKLLSQQFHIEEREVVLILMNVWSTLAIQFPQNYKDDFDYFKKDEDQSTSYIPSFLRKPCSPSSNKKTQNPFVNSIKKKLKVVRKKIISSENVYTY